MKTRRLSDKSQSSRRRCTKGASKQRRESLNCLINHLRQELPLPDSTREHLSQIQVMALARAYIRCSTKLSDVFDTRQKTWKLSSKLDFSEALPGFLLVVSEDYKLLYVSENVKNFLGYSTVELLTRNGTIYDIVSESDRSDVQSVLEKGFKDCQEEESTAAGQLDRTSAHMFSCKVRVSRSVRRQSRCDRYKMMFIRGHFINRKSSEDDNTSRSLFVGICSTQQCTQPQDSDTFSTKHSTDLKFRDVDECGEFHLGYSKTDLANRSFYSIVHPDDIKSLTEVHLQVMRGESPFCSASIRVQTSSGCMLPLSIRLQRCKTRATGQHIICSCRILNAKDLATSWSTSSSAEKNGKPITSDRGSEYQSSFLTKDVKRRRIVSKKPEESRQVTKQSSRPQQVVHSRNINICKSNDAVLDVLSEFLQGNDNHKGSYFDAYPEPSSTNLNNYSFVEELGDVDCLQKFLHANQIQQNFNTHAGSRGQTTLRHNTGSRGLMVDSRINSDESLCEYGSTIHSPASIDSGHNSPSYETSSGTSEMYTWEGQSLDYTPEVYNTPLTPTSHPAFSPPQQIRAKLAMDSNDQATRRLSYTSADSFLAELLSLPELDVALVESLLAKENYALGDDKLETSNIFSNLHQFIDSECNQYFWPSPDQALIQ